MKMKMKMLAFSVAIKEYLDVVAYPRISHSFRYTYLPGLFTKGSKWAFRNWRVRSCGSGSGSGSGSGLRGGRPSGNFRAAKENTTSKVSTQAEETSAKGEAKAVASGDAYALNEIDGDEHNEAFSPVRPSAGADGAYAETDSADPIILPPIDERISTSNRRELLKTHSDGVSSSVFDGKSGGKSERRNSFSGIGIHNGANHHPDPLPHQQQQASSHALVVNTTALSDAKATLRTQFDISVVDTVLGDCVLPSGSPHSHAGASGAPALTAHEETLQAYRHIAALDSVKLLLQEAITLRVLMPELFREIGTSWKGVLLFGPPGTGKACKNDFG
jgi:hypothetical protein